MTEKFIGYNGTSLYYFEDGSGVPLIFIHGFCEDHTVWDDFVIPFAKNYKVILIDLPGFGKSAMPEEDISISFYAEGVKAILDTEKISHCLMIGHSMGGYVTLNFASRFQQMLKGFVLFHSSSFEDDEVKKQDRIRIADFVRRNGAAPFVNELYNKLFAADYFSVHQKEIDALKKHGAKVSSVDGIAQASLAMGKRPDSTDVLKNAKVPVLFIIGKEDKLVPAEKSLQQSHLPIQSVICLLHGVAHMGMFEAKKKTQKHFGIWLELCNINYTLSD